MRLHEEREMPDQASAFLGPPFPPLQLHLPSDYNHMRHPKPESPSQAPPKFLTHRNHEIIKLFSFQPFNFGMICFAVADVENLSRVLVLILSLKRTRSEVLGEL